MDWYSIFKFLHVTSAIIWLGGGLLMVILGARAERARDDTDLVGVVLKVAWAADRIYVPASIATLVFGVIATWLGGLWGNLWVILGLVGVASTIFIGVRVLTPRAKRVKAGYDAGGVGAGTVAVSKEILTIAKFDMAVLFVVVADMVLKPGYDSWVLLVIMALVVIAAGAVWLSPVLRGQGAGA